MPDAAATPELQQLLTLHAVRVHVYAGYQSQVAVMGLPLQLSPEEVSLAAAAGAQQHEQQQQQQQQQQVCSSVPVAWSTHSAATDGAPATRGATHIAAAAAAFSACTPCNTRNSPAHTLLLS
jgi:hypothetical protein